MNTRVFERRERPDSDILTVASQPYDAVIRTPIPNLKLGLCFTLEVLSSIDFLDGDVPDRPARSESARRAVAQLRAYFTHPHAPLALPLAPGGTPFQQRVWAALRAIPVGETRRYGDLARQLDSAPRAIGGACRANPIPLVVPCHRVVAARGDGGFMGGVEGTALAVKRWLLQHERMRS